MRYRLRVWPKVPEGNPLDLEQTLASGMYHDGIVISAGWDDENRQHLGWVVPAGAEKYAKDYIEPLGTFRWEVEEFDEGV